MKARMHFDTLTYANKLKAAGMEPKLAEVQALALVEALEDGVATKVDITESKSEIKQEIVELRSEIKQEIAELRSEIKTLRAEFKQDIAEVRAELKGDMAELKSNLVKWMIGLFLANTSIIGFFMSTAQLMNHH